MALSITFFANAICGRNPLAPFGEMSRKLSLTQKQITAICKGASKAGFVPIIEVDGMNIKLVPKGSTPPPAETIDKPIEIRF